MVFRRLLLSIGMPLLGAVPAAATVHRAQAATQQLDSPRLAEIGVARAAIRDSVLSAPAGRKLAASASWGGTFTTPAGEPVKIRVSDSYPQDPARAQRWADFLGSLVHGSEISTVDVFLAPLDEVQRVCGFDALACYSPSTKMLVTPGDDPDVDVTAEAVVTHEYGHHVAGSRSDAPWAAIAYGTKRWASYEQVCANTVAGKYFPGAEDALRYRLNPGEAFAESYRVLNQQRTGVPETPWNIVTRDLYPDETALSLIQQDVLDPWKANSTSMITAGLKRSARVKTFTVPTTLDGNVRVTVRGAKNARVRVDLLSSSGKRTGTVTVAGGSTRSVGDTICGSRNVKIRVTATRGAGNIRLTVSKP
jgi:hypothetical protein